MSVVICEVERANEIYGNWRQPQGSGRMMVDALSRYRLDDISLFLDLDGTLAPFTDLPEEVGPDIARNALIRNLALRLQGRLAVVSGRPIADIDRILEGVIPAVAGSHGLQRRDARLDLIVAPVHSGVAQAKQEIAAFVRRYPELHVEEKPLSVALHYRLEPTLKPVVEVFAEDLARRTGLKLQRGIMVVEFLTPGMDKGRAVRAFMVEPPFAGTIPVFVGDDLTDEDGFRVVRSFGGIGVLVGALRETFADYRLGNVEAVHHWLERGLQTQYLELETAIEPSYRRI
ncbi:MAG: trehalose-phosphatase [Asticcacaulis sp.]|uniref:trehalose-phosphatase n=1 Tax=Asticcacaulis sp. TaxID=1872648 RepID=UPI0039E515BF